MALDTHQIFSKSIDHTNTSALVSPPPTTSPPLVSAAKYSHMNGDSTKRRERSEGSEAIDPSALTKALKEYEEAGRARERTPAPSPSRKRQRIYGDR